MYTHENHQPEGCQMKKIIIYFTPLILLLAGCAGNLMKPSASDTIQAPASDMATIVFMRTSFVSSAIGVELFEVVDGQLTFIGALPKGNKIAHQTTPGKKIYMAYGAAADFMIADVRAGQTYYSIVRPNWGTGGFAPTPIRKMTSEYNMKTPEFSDWVKDTKLLTLKKEEAQTWFAENKDKYNEIYQNYWNRFMRKNANEKAERTLNPEDGI
jgi:hypothetical protein